MLDINRIVHHMQVGAGGNGTVQEWRLREGWPGMIDRELSPFTAAGGRTVMVWFGWGFKPQPGSTIIQFTTLTHGRAAEDARYKALADTYQSGLVAPMTARDVHVLTYMGDPWNDQVLGKTKGRIKRLQLALENLEPCEGTEVVLDHCSQVGPEWIGRLRLVGELTGHRVTLEGWPQRDGFGHLREFGCMFMYASIDHPGPNGMALDEIQQAGFPVVYVIIRPGDLRPGEDMATVCAAMQARGFHVVIDSDGMEVGRSAVVNQAR